MTPGKAGDPYIKQDGFLLQKYGEKNQKRWEFLYRRIQEHQERWKFPDKRIENVGIPLMKNAKKEGCF